MKKQQTNQKSKQENILFQFAKKYITKYINAMTKIYFPETDTSSSKNDNDKIFYK